MPISTSSASTSVSWAATRTPSSSSARATREGPENPLRRRRHHSRRCPPPGAVSRGGPLSGRPFHGGGPVERNLHQPLLPAFDLRLHQPERREAAGESASCRKNGSRSTLALEGN